MVKICQFSSLTPKFFAVLHETEARDTEPGIIVQLLTAKPMLNTENQVAWVNKEIPWEISLKKVHCYCLKCGLHWFNQYEAPYHFHFNVL